MGLPSRWTGLPVVSALCSRSSTLFMVSAITILSRRDLVLMILWAVTFAFWYQEIRFWSSKDNFYAWLWSTNATYDRASCHVWYKIHQPSHGALTTWYISIWLMLVNFLIWLATLLLGIGTSIPRPYKGRWNFTRVTTSVQHA